MIATSFTGVLLAFCQGLAFDLCEHPHGEKPKRLGFASQNLLRLRQKDSCIAQTRPPRLWFISHRSRLTESLLVNNLADFRM